MAVKVIEMCNVTECWFIQVWNICDVCAPGKKKAKKEVDWKVAKKDVKTWNEKKEGSDCTKKMIKRSGKL